MPNEHPDIAARLLRGQRHQAYAMVALYLIVIVGIVYVWQQERQAHHALCTYRAGLVQSIQDSQQFLAANPGGLPGFPAATIQANIVTQQARVVSLSSLGCADAP